MIEKYKTQNETLYFGDALDLYHETKSEPHTLFFDPPWDAIGRYTEMASSKNVLAFCDGRRAADVVGIFGAPTWVFVWDCVSSWYTPNRPLQRAKLCFWYGDREKYRQSGYLFGEPCGRPRVVTNSRGTYNFVPAPGKMLSDVFSHPITSLHSGGRHRHSKPVDWVTSLIANTIGTSSIVIDPFCGSAVSAIGARQCGARWVGIDNDERAIDLAIDTLSTGWPNNPQTADLFSNEQ